MLARLLAAATPNTPTLLLMTSSTVWVNRDAATGDSASFAMADRLAGEFQKPANGPPVLAYFTHTFDKSMFSQNVFRGLPISASN